MTKEQEILSIAEEEFYRNGYQATSLVTIAKRAGVTHAMVHYYFRSKEQLFLKILDTHTYAFIEKLRPVMKDGGDFITTIAEASDIVFDTLNEDRMLPFLIQDVVRSAPELLNRYRQPIESFASETMEKHAVRLSAQVEEGKIAPTSLADLLENMLLLIASPFLMIPTLENVCGMSEEKIDAYLARRKKEIVLLLKARYRK